MPTGNNPSSEIVRRLEADLASKGVTISDEKRAELKRLASDAYDNTNITWGFPEPIEEIATLLKVLFPNEAWDTYLRAAHCIETHFSSKMET